MRFACIAAVLVTTLASFAQEKFVVSPPAAGRVVVQRELAYRADPAHTLDLYRPAGEGTVPLIIFVNSTGGPYATWPMYIGWATAAAAEGLGAVVYQSADKPSDDFDALMNFLRAKAAELHVDPTRVVIWSGSSNVQLGLPLAMDRARTYIRGAAVFYGFASVNEIRTDLPVLYVRSGLDSAGMNQQFDAIAARALAANAPWIIENHAAGLHGFEVLNDTEVSREIIHRTLEFARSVTRTEVSQAYAAGAADALLGAAFARGDWTVAAAGYKKKVAGTPGDAESFRRLGLVLTQTGDYSGALAALEKAWDLGRRGFRDTAYPAAIAAARAANRERALHWLGIVLESRFAPPLAEIRTSADFASLRDDAAFQALLAAAERRQAQ